MNPRSPRLAPGTAGLLVLILALMFAANPAQAHHGWSGNSAGDVEVTGTLETGLKLAGAHGTLQLRDEEGNLWDITLAPGPRTHRSGLREDTIPEGETITVFGERNDDPNVYEAKVRRVVWGEQVFDVYPPE